MIATDRGGSAFAIDHLDPGFASGVIHQESVEDTRETAVLCASSGIGKGLESQPVTEFVQQNCHQVSAIAVIVI
jgi:hypothetical protein